MEKLDPEEAIEEFARKKRSILFERILIFAIFVGLFHFFLDLISDDGVEAPIIDLCITAVLVIAYVLQWKGYFLTSRLLVVGFLNVCFAAYASLIPKEVGVYLFYFPMMAISMAVFGDDEKRVRMFFIFLSVVLEMALFISNFGLLGPYSIPVSHIELFFFVNLCSSTFMMVMCINFILRVNGESERRLRFLAEEIHVKNSNLEKTNSELDRFFYSTSHDLRSPLSSIKGLINVAMHDTEDVKTRQYLNMMNERVDKLDLFIRDIIDYSKNTRTELVKETVNILELVEDVKENFQFLEGAEKIKFKDEIKIEKAYTDKTRLTVILNNLISNAIKYHYHDRIDPWIKVSMQTIEGTLDIVISDNGPGIHPEKQSRIFDMFYRGTERSKGSGLGLYIVKETIAKMKGSIRVESVEGKGTSFIVKLPVTSPGIV